MAETWRFIDYGVYSPAYNMAFDEALLDWNSSGNFPPVIRFYGWNPPTLSLGYFQKAKEEINLEKVRDYNLGLVRRLTGGRSVLHDQELTYSVVVPEQHPSMPKTVTEAYRVISQGLLEGFRELGLDAYFSIPENENAKDALKNPRTAICFDTPSWYELVVEGKKVAGSAQTRHKGTILQHGSILIDLDEQKLLDLFRYPNERVRECIKKGFKSKAVSINSLSGKQVNIEQVKKAFKLGFEKGLNIKLEPYELTEGEKKYIEELALTRYQSEQWTFMR